MRWTHLALVITVSSLLVHHIQAKMMGKSKHVDSKTQINKVHIVFMNHLDVGYSDGVLADVGFVSQVVNRYLTKYFPTAINISRTLIEEGYVERFVYTTHPWLVSLYLDCPDISLLGVPLQCPNKTMQDKFVQAVREGHIAWHAFPMNVQTDFFSADLFTYGLNLTKQLDAIFGINRTHATMSQRDVPGITKGVLPLLMSSGVKAISVGVNSGTPPPDVPCPFLWKLRESDPDGVMGFLVKGGYPNNPGPYPSYPGGLAKDKCIMADGLDEALCFAFRTDNSGPPTTVKEILSYYEILRSEFPGAELVASTFDNFVMALESVKETLPVRTVEMGDVWIQGIASDPKKSAMYRAFARTWEECKKRGQCMDTDPRIQKMLRYLIKLPEHTWGAHNYLDNKAWTNQQLAMARKNDSYKLMESTWKEQREFLDLALNALEDHPLKQMVLQEYVSLEAKKPDLSGYEKAETDQDYSCPTGTIFNFASDGSLQRLYDQIHKREWASRSNLIGQLIYDTFDEQTFKDMGKLWDYRGGGAGYDKPNVSDVAHPIKKRWEVKMIGLYKNISSRGCDFWVEAATEDTQTRTKYGAPKVFYVHYSTGPVSQGLTVVNVSLTMLGKVTTRLPESISFGFSPINQNSKWSLSKVGQMIDPCNVVLNGSQYVHAIDSGVSLLDKSGKAIQILSQDVPLVTIGLTDHQDSPFPVPLTPLNCSKITTMSYNIYNNIWNTNYIYWYPYLEEDANFSARFAIKF